MYFTTIYLIFWNIDIVGGDDVVDDEIVFSGV